MFKREIIVPLSFGDEGKGRLSLDLITETKADMTIRHSGGCQGSHYVRFNDKVHYASQLSVGMVKSPQLITLIGKDVSIRPTSLIGEIEAMEKLGIENVSERICFMPESPILIPAHDFLCQTREFFSERKIGTTGIGIRELMADVRTGDEEMVLRVKDLNNGSDWVVKLARITEYQLEKARGLAVDRELIETGIKKYYERFPFDWLCQQFELMKTLGTVWDLDKINDYLLTHRAVFEPAQGTLLDHCYGFKPNVTSTSTTVKQAMLFLSDDGVRFWMLTRAYFTRHGTGLFMTEDFGGELNKLSDDNAENPFQGRMRFGWLDMVMLRYSLAVNQQFMNKDALCQLAITCLDQLSGLQTIKVCDSYTHLLGEEDRGYFIFDEDDRIVSIRPSLDSPMEEISLLLEQKCQPHYLEFSGWGTDISDCTQIEKLPAKARYYLDYISSCLEMKIGLISVGPNLNRKIMV